MSASETPQVTVIVTTYNHERYIEKALSSVVGQQTTFPFEVVVIEDCSTDGTRELVQAFAAEHPKRVRLALSNENGSFNRLFAEQWATSTSEYVATLDGDDFWTSPAKLQRQVEILEDRPEYSFCFHDVDVVSEGMSYVWEGRFTEGFGDGVRVRTLAWLDQAPGPTTPRDGGRTIDPKSLWSGCFVPGCSPLLRRNLLPALPEGFEDIVFSDWALYLLIGQHGPIMYLDEVLGTYRVHDAGMWSGVSRETQHEQVVRFLERMVAMLPASESVIRAEVERHTRLVEVERKRSARHRCIVEGLAEPPRRSALDSALADHVPPESKVIWIEPALRPVGLTQELLFFPQPCSSPWNVFDSGDQGQSSVPWIAPGYAYEFRLRSQEDNGGDLSTLTVIADRPAPGRSVNVDPVERREARREGRHLIANPNPAAAEGTHARTEISWATGDGSAGTVLVAPYALEEGLPVGDAEAIDAVEQLRRSGGEFMLVASACARLFELYPGLVEHLTERYKLAFEDPDVGRLYDLRR